jgi:hypothetical protein
VAPEWLSHAESVAQAARALIVDAITSNQPAVNITVRKGRTGRYELSTAL